MAGRSSSLWSHYEPEGMDPVQEWKGEELKWSRNGKQYLVETTNDQDIWRVKEQEEGTNGRMQELSGTS